MKTKGRKIVNLKNNLCIFVFAILSDVKYLYAVELYLDFFTRPVKAENVLLQTPEYYDGRFFFIQDGKLFLFEKSKIQNPIEITIGQTPISEIYRSKNFLFCSDDSKVVEISRYGVEKEEDIPFPCITPPLQINGKIYSVDLKSNVCYISESEKKCIRLREEKFGEIKLLELSDPKILKYKKNIIVPYENEIFIVSEDLRIRYKVLEFENSNRINSISVIGNKLYVSTKNSISVFDLQKEGEAIKPIEISTTKIEEITGADFSEDIIAFTYKQGFGVIRNGKVFLKPIRGIIDISYPVIQGDNLFFIAQFGEKTGRIFGPRKNSLIVVSLKDNKPKIKKEYILHAFSRKIKTSGNRLYFLADDSTLYVFRIFLGKEQELL